MARTFTHWKILPDIPIITLTPNTLFNYLKHGIQLLLYSTFLSYTIKAHTVLETFITPHVVLYNLYWPFSPSNSLAVLNNHEYTLVFRVTYSRYFISRTIKWLPPSISFFEKLISFPCLNIRLCVTMHVRAEADRYQRQQVSLFCYQIIPKTFLFIKSCFIVSICNIFLLFSSTDRHWYYCCYL